MSARPEPLTPEWWVYFNDLGTRMVIEGYTTDLACISGAHTEAEYFG